MVYFTNIINYRDSILLIEQLVLDQKVWSLLTERIFIVMKNFEKLNESKNKLDIDIYEVLMEDLKNIYNFYKVSYLMVSDKLFSERLTAGILFNLGELKRFKLVVNKRFNKSELVEKDVKESLRFYQYSLNKNPFNHRAYSNMGLIIRDNLKDFTLSSYWFVRCLAVPGFESKLLKENLDADFIIIRKLFIEKEHLVDKNPAYLNYDIEHLPLLWHRIMGILYMSTDTDKLEELIDSFEILLEKILKYYYNISEEIRIEMETQMIAEQIVLMLIFNFHHTLNNFSDYPNQNEKIVLNSNNMSNLLINNKNLNIVDSSVINSINNNMNYIGNMNNINNQSFTTKKSTNTMQLFSSLKYELFNHNILGILSEIKEKEKENTNPNTKDIYETLNMNSNSNTNSNVSSCNYFNLIDNVLKDKVKYGFKYSCRLIKGIVEKVMKNYNKHNQQFSEKILLLFFYWFSINYDVLNNLILSEKSYKPFLEFINYNITSQVSSNLKLSYLQTLNQSTTPLECNLLAFKPMTRFFELNNIKAEKCNDTLDSMISTKIILSHMLNISGIKSEFNKDINDIYECKENQFSTTIVNLDNNNSNELNKDLENMMITNKNVQSILNVKKMKPLILLDMSNIAMRHGNSEKFSTKGIKICLDFFVKNGHEVCGFLPEYLFRDDKDNKQTRMNRKIIPDDVVYLKDLHSKGLVIQTPSHDYDDSYNIKYCKTKTAFFVTNDLYRDYIEKITDVKAREAERRWISSKRISYTFNKDEFIPGPDNDFFKEFDYNTYLKAEV